MKKTRKVQLAVASVLCATSAVAGLAFMNDPTQVKADGQTSTYAFAMENGAAVRAVANQAGIRWATNVSEEWYTENIPENATVSFGTFVTGASKVTSIDELNAENYSAETHAIKDLACTATADFEENGTFTYYSSIVYNNMSDWEDEEKFSAYATELIARSYVKYSTDGGNTFTYKYADVEDSTRCMRAVALAAYEDESENGLTDTQKGVVDDYFKTGATEAVAVDSNGDGICETAGEKNFGGYTAAYIGAKRVGTITEGTLTLNGDFAFNETCTLTLFDANGNYAKTAESKYITQFIDNKTEIAGAFDVAGDITGYYVLTEDININTYYGDSSQASNFKGTLDGEGHTISGIKMSGGHSGGLFNKFSGTIKNVRLEGAMTGSNGYGLIAAQVPTGASATLENVYIEYSAPTASGATTHSSPTFRFVYGTLMMKNVVAYTTNANQSVGGGLVGALMSGTSTTAASNTTFENCYSITTNAAINAISTVQTTTPLPIQNGDVTAAYGGENALGYFADAIQAGTVTLSDELEAMMDIYVVTQKNIASYFDVAGDITGYYVLTEDVNINTYYGDSSQASNFKGTLDGEGHTISGIKMSGGHSGGLFNKFSGTIKNVRLEGAMTGSNGYGLIAAQVPTGASATLENVYIEYSAPTASGATTHSSPTFRFVYGTLMMKNVVAYTTNANQSVGGGLVGALMSGTSTTAASNTTFENCYSITTNAAIGGLSTAQTAEPVPIQNGSIAEYKGETAKADFDAAVTDGTITLTEELKALMDIYFVTQANFASYFNVSGDVTGNYVLTEDIDLGNTYYGKATFSGTIDGQGHTISGIKMPNNTLIGGLFANFSGTIKNVRIEGKMEGKQGYGLIAAQVPAGATALVENVYFEYTNITTKSSAHSSPTFRFNYGDLTLRNVVAYCTSSDTTYGGVLMGALMRGGSTTTFENCYTIMANATINAISTAQAATDTEAAPIQIGEATEYKSATAKADFDAAVTAGTVTLTNELKALTYPKTTAKVDEKGNIYLTQENIATFFNVAGDITGYYVLTEDVNINTYYGDGSQASNFKGTLDGEGHTISGIKMSGGHSGGLFNKFSGTIKNVRLEGAMTGSNGYGLIAAQVPTGASALVENVYFEYTSNTTTTHSSPTFRFVYGTLMMKNVVAYTTNANQSVGGGLVGALMSGTSTTAASNTTFENCYSITTNAAIGGLSTAQTAEPVPIQNGSIAEYKGATAKATFDAAVTAGTATLTKELKALMYPTGDAVSYSELAIAIAADASSEVRSAALTLQALIKEATGETLTIVHGNGAFSKVISLGETAYAKAADVTAPDDLYDYGYVIKTVNGSVYIVAPTDIGVTFGVYGFLKREFNYECYSDVSYAIDHGDLSFSAYDVTYDGGDLGTPYRGSAYLDGDAMRAMGYVDRNTGVQGLNVPSSETDPVSQQIPYNTYAAEHPKWFYSLSETSDPEWSWEDLGFVSETTYYPVQLCYTAQGDEAEYNALVAKAAEVLEEQLKDLNTKDVRFSTKDNKFWCKCTSCTEKKNYYGSESAVLTLFINDVAAEIDRWMANEGSAYAHDYEIQYLAYHRTVQPAFNALEWDATTQTYTVKEGYEEVLPAEHTVPVYASMRTNYHLSPNDAYNLEFKKQILGWQALTKAGGTGLGIWSYFLDYSNYWLFYDSYTYMAEWYQLYAAGGNTTWFYEESIHSTGYYDPASLGYSGTAWTALRNYLSAKLAKDTTLDQTALTKKFFMNYYGTAWETVYEVFQNTVAVSKTMSANFTYDCNAVSSKLYNPSTTPNGKTNLVNMGTNYEDAYPVYGKLDDAQYWSYDFAKGAYDALTAALETVGLTEQQILNIRAERLSYEYMLVEYYADQFTTEDLLALKTQAKEDATLNKITTISMKNNKNAKRLSGTAADLWAEWFPTTEETEEAE